MLKYLYFLLIIFLKINSKLTDIEKRNIQLLKKKEQCKYELKTRITDLKFKIQPGNKLEINLIINYSETLKYKTHKIHYNKWKKEKKITKTNFKIESQDLIRMNKFRLIYQVKGRYFLKNPKIYQRNIFELEKSLAKSKEDDDKVFLYTLDGVPCDLEAKIASVSKLDASWSTEETGGFIGMNQDLSANISLDMDTKIEFLNKFHLKMNENDFLDRICGNDNKKLKIFKSLKDFSLCTTNLKN